MSNKRQFQPIPVTLDEDEDQRLADYAKRSGIPEIKRPVAAVTPVAPDVPLHVTVPEYVLKKLKIKAAEDGVSIRYLVLKALSDSASVPVTEADLIHDRRSKKAR
jgi:hypothetical protein